MSNFVVVLVFNNLSFSFRFQIGHYIVIAQTSIRYSCPGARLPLIADTRNFTDATWGYSERSQKSNNFIVSTKIAHESNSVSFHLTAGQLKPFSWMKAKPWALCSAIRHLRASSKTSHTAKQHEYIFAFEKDSMKSEMKSAKSKTKANHPQANIAQTTPTHHSPSKAQFRFLWFSIIFSQWIS